MNCFTHVTFHFQNRTSPHHQDLLTQTIYFWHEHYQTWLHNTQLIINEMRLEAGKLIAAVENGECGRKKKLSSKQKNAKSLQLGPINWSPFRGPTVSPPKIITAIGNNDTVWARGQVAFWAWWLRSQKSAKECFPKFHFKKVNFFL